MKCLAWEWEAFADMTTHYEIPQPTQLGKWQFIHTYIICTIGKQPHYYSCLKARMKGHTKIHT